MKITHEQIRNLSDEQLIQIANVLEPRTDWTISKKYTESQNIYEVLSEDVENDIPGYHEAIVQFLFGPDCDDGEDGRYLIRHFDIDFMEGSPTDDELKQIIEIING